MSPSELWAGTSDSPRLHSLLSRIPGDMYGTCGIPESVSGPHICQAPPVPPGFHLQVETGAQPRASQPNTDAGANQVRDPMTPRGPTVCIFALVSLGMKTSQAVS